MKTPRPTYQNKFLVPANALSLSKKLCGSHEVRFVASLCVSKQQEEPRESVECRIEMMREREREIVSSAIGVRLDNS